MSKTRELEARVERLEEQLRLFQKVSRLMIRDLEIEDVLAETVRLIQDYLSCDSCLIYLVEGSRLVLSASTEQTRAKIGRVSLQMSEGLTGWVARERRLVAISSEAYADPRFKFFSDLPQDYFEAFLSVPIISQSKVVGVINVQNQAPRIHTGSEIEALSTVGEQVGCLLVLSRQKSYAAGTTALVRN